MRYPRRLLVAVAATAVITASTGCASTGAAPGSTLGAARLAIAAVQVPPPPEYGSRAVIGAWSALRAASLQTALEAAGRVPVAELSTAAGRALAGFVALRGGDLSAAQDSFGAALGAEPEMPEAAYGMGLVAQKRGQPDLARKWFGTALRQAPGMTRASVALRRIDLQAVDGVLAAAESARSSGDMEGAEQHYREANGLAPGVEGPYLQLAALYRAQGDEARGMAVLSEGLRNVGDSPGLLEPLAVLYREAGLLAEASDTFDRLRQALPGDERAMRLARGARERYEIASLPLEYRALQARAETAAKSGKRPPSPADQYVERWARSLLAAPSAPLRCHGCAGLPEAGMRDGGSAGGEGSPRRDRLSHADPRGCG